MALKIKTDNTQMDYDTSRGQWVLGSWTLDPFLINTGGGKLKLGLFPGSGCHGHGYLELYNAAGTKLVTAHEYSPQLILTPVAAGSEGDATPSGSDRIFWDVDPTSFASGSKAVLGFGGTARGSGMSVYTGAVDGIFGEYLGNSRALSCDAGGRFEIVIPFEVVDE